MGADGRAVAQAQAAIGAFTAAAEEQFGCGTGGNAVVLHLVAGVVAVSVAPDKGHLLHHVFKFHAQQGADVLGGFVSAGDAEIGFDAALLQGVSVAVAAGIAAGAAVGAGQAFTEFYKGVVLFDGDDLGGHSSMTAQMRAMAPTAIAASKIGFIAGPP